MMLDPNIIAGSAAGIVGVATVLINSRLSFWKSRVEQLEREFGEFKTEFKIRTSERDTAKADLEKCKDARIELLTRLNGFERASAALDSRLHAAAAQSATAAP